MRTHRNKRGLFTKSRTIAIFMVSAIPFFVLSCRKIVVYPDEPQISFTGITLADTMDVLDNPMKLITLTFHLIDGNGDVGLDSTYLTGPFHPDSLYHYNLFIREYYQINGVWSEVPKPAGERKFRVPDLTPAGQNKTLIADISVKLEYPYSNASPLKYRELQYQFHLVDRAFNHSNRDTSSVVVFW